MVTISSADNALKTLYLGVVAEQLNTAVNPLLAKINQTTSDVWGKEIRKLAPFGINGGIGAGTEEGDLPLPASNNYAQFVLTLKNLYGTIEITDKAMRASENNSGAFVNFNQGLDCRLLTTENIRAINAVRVKDIHFAWDHMEESGAVVRGLRRYAAYASRKVHGAYATVYCLVNYGTTMKENLFRIYTLRDMGFDPYVMIYDKPNAPRGIRMLQRWCNNRLIFKSVPDFKDYNPKRG